MTFIMFGSNPVANVFTDSLLTEWTLPVSKGSYEKSAKQITLHEQQQFF